MEIKFRHATLSDIGFLSETVISAEKSGTATLSYNTIFGLSENDAQAAIERMFLEEIDHCEFAVSAFFLAEFEEKAVAAICMWIEEADGMSSAMLKGNLLKSALPKDNFEKAFAINPILRELAIDHIPGAVQLGLVYVANEARGQGIVKQLLERKIADLQETNPGLSEIYVQVFANNLPAIRTYENFGFAIVEKKHSRHPDIQKYLPCDTKLLMKKSIN